MKPLLLSASFATILLAAQLQACCPVGRSGKPIMNADQTVIILWDAAQQKQHFIRKASFAAEDQDFGFIIPSPSEPELSESGNEAFDTLKKLTEPEIIYKAHAGGGMGCGCSDAKSVVMATTGKSAVIVLQEKQVAGFQAVVLEAKSSSALTTWLKDHGYAYTTELAAWAQPYIDQGWKFTALKVAVKDKAEANKKLVEASALRMSFKTEKPLFPYREPAYGDMGTKLNQKNRLLRIYVLADTSFHGNYAASVKDPAWSGKVAWAGPMKPEARTKVLEQLKLPAETGPAKFYLTEYEDNWPYTLAPGDVYFSKDAQPNIVKRQPIIEYASNDVSGDVSILVMAGVLFVPPLFFARAKETRTGAACLANVSIT
ncbi:MAG: DUF2330 domain-containing protein [Gemmatales bacterium]